MVFAFDFENYRYYYSLAHNYILGNATFNSRKISVNNDTIKFLSKYDKKEIPLIVEYIKQPSSDINLINLNIKFSDTLFEKVSGYSNWLLSTKDADLIYFFYKNLYICTEKIQISYPVALKYINENDR